MLKEENSLGKFTPTMVNEKNKIIGRTPEGVKRQKKNEKKAGI